MIIPNLIIPGAAKSGTSSLHQYLNLHPHILMSSQKEPHFFTLKARYNEGLIFYSKIFSNKKKSIKYYGESSTSYFPNKEALHRIKSQLINVKFILILRNPLERSISHYKWLVSIGSEKRKFRNAVQDNIKNQIDYNMAEEGGVWKGFFTSSLYGYHLSHMYSIFSKEDIFVITTEELASNPYLTINKCFHFLGLSPLKEILEIRENVTKRKRNSIGLGWVGIIPQYPVKKIVSLFKNKIRNLFVNKNSLLRSIKDEDKEWLKDLLKEDLELLKTFHPELVSRWKI